MKIRIIASIFLLFLCFSGFSQQTAVFTEAQRYYKQGNEFYSKGLFGPAQKEYQKAINLLLQVNEPEFDLLRAKSQLGYAQSGVRLDQPDGKRRVVDFTRRYAPDPAAQQALLEIGNYYYNEKDYDEAIKLYKQIDTDGLTREQRTEVLFKLGYCQFVKKDFDDAKENFKQTIEIENQFYYPSNYYYGLTEFFDTNYDEAIKSFQRVSRSQRYKAHVPFYITQIYFAKGEFDNVLKYAIPKVDDNTVSKRAEMNQLIGQAYFEKKEYLNALPYFEYFLKKAEKIREEDYYQIGFSYYKTEDFGNAVDNFEQLSKVESDIGQNAMYTLGDCHLKLDDKNRARNAFLIASKMEFDSVLQQTALFNYAKLSYELNYDRAAMTSLQQVKPSTEQYEEAQDLLSNLFLKSKDFKRAVEILEDIPDKTPKLRESYQEVTFLRGLQLYREKELDGAESAKVYFNKSLEEPVNNRTRALTIFWKGEIAHSQGDYELSISEINKFLSLARGIKDLPEESSIYVANYIQGYNYLKKENYTAALEYFSDAINGIRQNARNIENEYITEYLLGDAVQRAGDCLFKRNRYNEALVYYNEAVEKRYEDFDYSLFQKAIIEGLEGRNTEKILALEELADNYPNSNYADEALLFLGSTYQEMDKFSQAQDPLIHLVKNYKGRSNLINKALLKLGLINYTIGNVQAALDYYKQVFENNPEPAESTSALAAIQEIYVDDLGQPDKYIEFLESIPGYNVGDAEKEKLSFEAAEAQYENGNYERAISGYDRYLQRYPNGRYSLVVHYNRGEANAILRNYSEALVNYDYVVNKGLSNYYERALRKAAIISRVHEKDYQRAFKYYTEYEEITAAEDEKLEAMLGALICAYEIKNTDAVYQLANKINNAELANNEQKSLAYFYFGKLSYEQNDTAEALNAFRNSGNLADTEEAAESRYMIAKIYYEKRDLEKAKELCLNSPNVSASYPEWVARHLLLLADIFAEQGDLFNAKAILEGLIENFEESPEILEIARKKLDGIETTERANSRLDTNTEDDLLEMDESINEGGN